MAIHWTIAFKSLRSGTDYRINIYDANYSGASSINLKGAAEPFTTEEDDDEDMIPPSEPSAAAPRRRRRQGNLQIIRNQKAK